jgi:indolepyruvate ferredoxin oxidoreductase beta subunit
MSHKFHKTSRKGGGEVSQDSVNIALVGVGGQGIIMLTRILGEAAFKSNLNIMGSELHGMAQRGGQVTSNVRFGDVHSPMIGKGEANVILGLEPVETYRHLDMASKDTIIITSTNPIIPFTVTSGGESYPEMDNLLSAMDECPKKLVKLDIEGLISKHHLPNIVGNMIMLGALAGAYSDLPVSSEILKEVIKENVPSKLIDKNLKAFEIGYEIGNRNK